MLGSLDPAWRIFAPPVAKDREFWGFLAAVVLVYIAVLLLLLPAVDRAVENEVRRRGQVDDPTSISIEVVEEPDQTANALHDRSGTEAPAPPEAQPAARPPEPSEAEAQATVRLPPAGPPHVRPQQPEPVESLRPTQPPDEVASTREGAAEQSPAADPQRPESTDLLGVDLTMRDYAAALDVEIERRKREQALRRSAPQPRVATLSGASRLRGSPSSGHSDAYSRSVIAALLRAKPPPFALRGSVMVSFEISPSGGLHYVRVIDSSGNKAMDAEAVAAIRRARFDPPPAGKSRADLTYIIHFIFD